MQATIQTKQEDQLAQREMLLMALLGGGAHQYFTLPHMIYQILSDSSGVQMSHIVTWWVRWTLLEFAGVNVDCCPEKALWDPWGVFFIYLTLS